MATRCPLTGRGAGKSEPQRTQSNGEDAPKGPRGAGLSVLGCEDYCIFFFIAGAGAGAGAGGGTSDVTMSATAFQEPSGCLR